MNTSNETDMNDAGTKKTTDTLDARSLALEALLQINEEGRLSHIVINEALDKYPKMDQRERGLLVRLVHGSLEYQIQSDMIVDRFSTVKTAKLKPYIRNLFRLAVYQIMHMDRIPDHAVINTAVSMIGHTAFRNLKGFVNGVLRNISRNKENICPDTDSFRYSAPEELICVLIDSLGKEAAYRYLSSSLKKRQTTVRICGTDRVEILNAPGKLTELAEWKEGKITVQDYSAARPVAASSIKTGDTVIDVCASPGGKSIQAYEKSGNKGHVIACDISEYKLELIRANAVRCHAELDIRLCDAAQYHEEFDSAADVVLADLPCSGLGTISGKPDIKNRFSYKDCLSLAQIQKNILDNVCRYVKPHGELIYSTCTLTKCENQDNVRDFLVNHKDYRLKEMVQLLPDEETECDGFFYAVLMRDQPETNNHGR